MTAWSEPTVTWATQPLAAEPCSVIQVGATQTYYTWNVTTFVRGFYGGDWPNLGFLMQNTNEAQMNERAFHSRDSAFAGGRPQLRIRYVPGVSGVNSDFTRTGPSNAWTLTIRAAAQPGGLDEPVYRIETFFEEQTPPWRWAEPLTLPDGWTYEPVVRECLKPTGLVQSNGVRLSSETRPLRPGDTTEFDLRVIPDEQIDVEIVQMQLTGATTYLGKLPASRAITPTATRTASATPTPLATTPTQTTTSTAHVPPSHTPPPAHTPTASPSAPTATPTIRSIQLVGYKFEDLNRNGIWEGDPATPQVPGNEPPIAGWNVTLSGPVISGAITDAAGRFALAINQPGTYLVTEEERQGWRAWTPASVQITVHGIPGETIPAILFGNAPACAGDCTGEGAVRPDDLRIIIEALFNPQQWMASCPNIDRDGNGRATAHELVASLREALAGCGS